MLQSAGWCLLALVHVLNVVVCREGGFPLGASVGVGVGGGALLLAACFCVCCTCCLYCRRRRRKRKVGTLMETPYYNKRLTILIVHGFGKKLEISVHCTFQ